MANSFYEKHVKDYQKVTNLWFPKRHNKLISLIAFQPKRILDIACGTGIMLERIQSIYPSAKLSGIDLSPAMIEYAKKSHPQYPFEIGSAEELPFKDESFDLLTNSISFHHYTKPQQSINEAYRVLEKGGQYLLMDISPKYKLTKHVNDFAAIHIIRDGHVAFRKLSDVKAMFEKAGFHNIEQTWVGLPGVYITSGRK